MCNAWMSLPTISVCPLFASAPLIAKHARHAAAKVARVKDAAGASLLVPVSPGGPPIATSTRLCEIAPRASDFDMQSRGRLASVENPGWSKDCS